MSLRAKIEAVVYAAEEPVTLAQLASLFADEALEWKREHQDPVAPPEESPEAVAEQVPLPAEFDPVAELASDADPSLRQAGTDSAASEPATEELAAETVQPAAAPEDAAPSAEAEAKRVGRQREREVRDTLRALLDELIAEYALNDRGIEIREIAGGYRIGTKPEYHDSVRSFVKSLKPPMKLSLQALETLAVIAYKQPVTAPEVSEIRGVDTSGVLGGLISRKLITTAGRKQVIGRPILYKTTKEFLLRFGLKDVSELPSIEEFEKMASELTDAEISEEPENSTSSGRELPFHEADVTEIDVVTEGGEIPEPQVEAAAEPPATTSAEVPETAPEKIPQQEVAEASHPVPHTVPAEEE
jgi:segregation and condensation protein B